MISKLERLREQAALMYSKFQKYMERKCFKTAQLFLSRARELMEACYA